MKIELNSLLNRVDTRLAACAAAAGASLAVVPATQADIIYSGMVNLNVPSTTAGIYLNVVNGVFGTTPASAPGWNLNPWGSTTFNVWANNTADAMAGVISGLGGSTTLVDNLAFGTLVDGSGVYARTGSSETTGATAFTLNGTTNYIGFRFFNTATGAVNYGWASFTLGATTGGQPRTLVSFAYDNTGAGINVGAIPEPSTFALLGVMAMGALGVRAWRKRKAA